MKSFLGAVVLIVVLVTLFQVEETSASSGLGFQTLMNPKADSCDGACFSPGRDDEKECPCPSGSARCCRNSDNHCRCCANIPVNNPPKCCASTGWAPCK